MDGGPREREQEAHFSSQERQANSPNPFIIWRERERLALMQHHSHTIHFTRNNIPPSVIKEKKYEGINFFFPMHQNNRPLPKEKHFKRSFIICFLPSHTASTHCDEPRRHSNALFHSRIKKEKKNPLIKPQFQTPLFSIR